MPKKNPFRDFLKVYRNDRVQFVQRVLKVRPEIWQQEALAQLDQGQLRLTIRSGHGVGKTAFLSWTMLHFLLFRWPCKVVVTAPSASQLFDALAAETKRWIKELPEFASTLIEVKTDRIELKASPTEAFISFRTSRQDQPEALQGVHADHVLLVVDEASGVPEAVFEAARGSMSTPGAITLLTGNPTRASGYFHATHTRNRDRWWVRKVSCGESSRVDPKFVQDIIDDYGDDSNVYRVRCLGEFPRADDDTLIPLYLVEDAVARDMAPNGEPPVWGLDVARFGDDSTCLVKRQGNRLMEPPRVWKNIDLMQTVGRVKQEYDLCEVMLRPSEILVDSIGLGSGVVDRLRELGLPTTGVNVSESPALGTHVLRLRDEIWLQAKHWFETRECQIPDDSRLISELTSVRFKITSGGKYQIESKGEMKRRGLRSPDVADAFCLTFAHNGSVAAGASVKLPWRQSINDMVDTSWVV